MGRDDDSDSAGISIGIPRKFVVYVIAAAAVGGMGVNTALFKATPSAEQADLLRIIAAFGEQVTEYGTRLNTTDARVEDLRVDILTRTASRVTQEDVEKFEREQDRKHAELEAADAQLRRAVEAIERELDKERGLRE